jgi:DNA polymerase-3 subunit alpha
LIRRYPGRREMKLIVVSRLMDVVIDSAIRVDNKLLEELGVFDGIDVV